MAADNRLDQIVELVDGHGFISVKELSALLDVSEVTVRRDLQQLEDDKRLKKTYGGAISLRAASSTEPPPPPPSPAEGSLIDRVDVLIATSLDPQSDRALMDRAGRRNLAVVGESLGISGMRTVVSVDNFLAAQDLGRWAGRYAQKHLGGHANLLDLSYRLSNTQMRSQGFIAGLREVMPNAQVVLSINAQSRYETAYQLAADALSVHPEINIIFGINDATAWGATCAARDRGIDPSSLLILTFGLEGDTMRNALAEHGHCRVGLAMFPEIVAPVCIEAAIAAYANQSLASQLVTPYAIVTPETLTDFYTRRDQGWELSQNAAQTRLSIPLKIERGGTHERAQWPKRIGFVVPFSEHEWYKNLTALMRSYAASLGIEFEAVDAAETIRADLALRQRAIAQMAAAQVQPGDVLVIDGSEVTLYLAEELANKENITVITNSVPVFQALRNQPNISIISTGGSLRRSSDTLIGPTAETALAGLRADKLFLAVTGISMEFGLSHTNLSEVNVKQAMLRAAREVILLADHTRFGQESVIQIAPVKAVNKVITDNALPASTRLELSKLGIEVITAKT
ncbi:MAG: DeoR family transcriptional regulator [Anaerolineae bacterium]